MNISVMCLGAKIKYLPKVENYFCAEDERLNLVSWLQRGHVNEKNDRPSSQVLLLFFILKSFKNTFWSHIEDFWSLRLALEILNIFFCLNPHLAYSDAHSLPFRFYSR